MIQVSGFIPYKDRIVVKLLPKKEKTDGGIIIADTVSMEASEGTIVSKGADVSKEIADIGKVILFSSKAGWEIEVNGEKLKVLREPEVEGEVF